jgi:putative transposase
VFSAKYRRVVIDTEVDQVLKEACLEIEKRYEIKFLEIGMDKDHINFLVQAVPTYSVRKLVTMIKSLSASTIPSSQEATVGWRILVIWILCKHGGKAWR